MDPSEIVEEDDGRWGLSRGMVSIGVAKIGITSPFILDKGVNICGESYTDH